MLELQTCIPARLVPWLGPVAIRQRTTPSARALGQHGGRLHARACFIDWCRLTDLALHDSAAGALCPQERHICSPPPWPTPALRRSRRTWSGWNRVARAAAGRRTSGFTTAIRPWLGERGHHPQRRPAERAALGRGTAWWTARCLRARRLPWRAWTTTPPRRDFLELDPGNNADRTILWSATSSRQRRPVDRLCLVSTRAAWNDNQGPHRSCSELNRPPPHSGAAEGESSCRWPDPHQDQRSGDQNRLGTEQTSC